MLFYVKSVTPLHSLHYFYIAFIFLSVHYQSGGDHSCSESYWDLDDFIQKTTEFSAARTSSVPTPSSSTITYDDSSDLSTYYL